MTQLREDSLALERITGVVLDLLDAGGYDAVQLREVARRAKVSLAKVYRLFPTRDDLILTAIERWMAENCYAELAPRPPGESVHDGLMRTLRYVFEPWERHPRMLAAYHLARIGPGGKRLDRQGLGAIEPVAGAVLAGADEGYVADVKLVLETMSYALIGRFVAGQLGVGEILPALGRAVRLLTANNERATRP